MLAFAVAILVTGRITFRTSIVSSQTWIFWVENANTRVRFFPLLSRICKDVAMLRLYNYETSLQTISMGRSHN